MSEMKRMPFYKFDGAGNDFVVVDNRGGEYALSEEEIARMCHRRYGVGADGLMTLERVADASAGYDFEMRYYNSDGRLGSMCGNGGRCIALFASLLGMGDRLHFLGYDGAHEAVVRQWDAEKRRATVDLTMREVRKSEIRRVEGGVFIDTGSPHFVLEVEELEAVDVVVEGRRWRHRADLFPEGTNVDFIRKENEGVLSMRTYERGVEDETLACGTGVTACALVTGCRTVQSREATFAVGWEETDEAFTKVTLTGPASLNYTGTWTYFQA